MSIHVILRVEEQTQQQLKVVWTVISQGRFSGNFGPYSISLQQLRAATHAVRELLNDLVAEYVEETYQYGPVLERLADAGAGLHFTLFEGAVRDKTEATKAQDWLAKQAPDSVEITVCTDGTAHVPWGLIFADTVPTTQSQLRTDYEGFWAFRYNVATQHVAMQPSRFQQGLQDSAFKVISLLDREIFGGVKQRLPESEQALLDTLLNRPIGSAFDTDEGIGYLKQAATSDCLLNVFSHASGQDISLSSGSLSINDLRRYFLHPRQKTPDFQAEALLFLNGCNTAVGDLDNSFLTATAEPGCAGFIGSEAKLPDEFALRAAVVVLHGLLREGLTAQAVVRRLWYDHWPLGLLYGCYAVPDFRVAMEAQASPPSCIAGINLSAG